MRAGRAAQPGAGRVHLLEGSFDASAAGGGAHACMHVCMGHASLWARPCAVGDLPRGVVRYARTSSMVMVALRRALGSCYLLAHALDTVALAG